MAAMTGRQKRAGQFRQVGIDRREHVFGQIGTQQIPGGRRKETDRKCPIFLMQGELAKGTANGRELNSCLDRLPDRRRAQHHQADGPDPRQPRPLAGFKTKRMVFPQSNQVVENAVILRAGEHTAWIANALLFQPRPFQQDRYVHALILSPLPGGQMNRCADEVFVDHAGTQQ